VLDETTCVVLLARARAGRVGYIDRGVVRVAPVVITTRNTTVSSG